MTAHRDKPTISAEWIRWFADYYRDQPAWGIFHVSLSDGNWKLGAADFDPATRLPRAQWPSEMKDAADWFDRLTPSQRRRLKIKAQDLAHTIVRPP